MSRFPGRTMEDFVDDAWMAGCDFAGIKRALEPMRVTIEGALESYLDDGGDAEHSWRDWRNNWFDFYTSEIDACLRAAGLDGRGYSLEPWLTQEKAKTAEGKGLCSDCNHWHVGYCRTCDIARKWCDPL